MVLGGKERYIAAKRKAGNHQFGGLGMLRLRIGDNGRAIVCLATAVIVLAVAVAHAAQIADFISQVYDYPTNPDTNSQKKIK